MVAIHVDYSYIFLLHFFIINCNIEYFYLHNEETAQQRLSQHESRAVQLNFFFYILISG